MSVVHFDLQFEINVGNVFLLPRRGLCCFASWVFVTFDFRTLSRASSNEQRPNPTETSPGGPAVSEAQSILVSTELLCLGSRLLPTRLLRAPLWVASTLMVYFRHKQTLLKLF